MSNAPRGLFVSTIFNCLSPFRNSLPGSESNRVVKEWRLLTRESESSKGWHPCESTKPPSLGTVCDRRCPCVLMLQEKATGSGLFTGSFCSRGLRWGRGLVSSPRRRRCFLSRCPRQTAGRVSHWDEAKSGRPPSRPCSSMNSSFVTAVDQRETPATQNRDRHPRTSIIRRHYCFVREPVPVL